MMTRFFSINPLLLHYCVIMIAFLELNFFHNASFLAELFSPVKNGMKILLKTIYEAIKLI